MKPTIALLVALSACIDTSEPVDLDHTEQALDGNARVRMFEISSGAARSSVQSARYSTTYTPFESLGGMDLRKLATERNRDGHLSLFAIGGDGALYGRYQTAPGGGWNPEGWQAMGGGWIEQVITARNLDGRIELFVRNTWGNVFHRYQVTPNGGWNPEGWLSLGGTELRTMAAATRSDGRIELVAVGGDRHLYHRSQTAPNSGGWDDWFLLPGSDLDTVALARGAVALEMVALDTSGNVEGSRSDGAGGWGPLTVLGNRQMSQVVVGTLREGELDILGVNSSGYAFDLRQASVTYVWNAYFNPLGWDHVAQLAVANEATSRLDAFARRTDNTISIAGESWTGTWSSLLPFDILPATDLVAIDQE